jgi:hypothetical protein
VGYKLEPYYMCTENLVRRAGKPCQSVRGSAIDDAIGSLLLESVAPAALEVAARVKLVYMNAPDAPGFSCALIRQDRLQLYMRLIRKTLPEVVAKVDELLETGSDRQVAEQLNALGYTNWKGEAFTHKKVFSRPCKTAAFLVGEGHGEFCHP